MSKLSKGVSLLIVLLAYCVAFAICFFCFRWIISWTSSVILAFLVMDIIATIIVWSFGLICKNASLYDPYWSVTPIIMAVFFTIIVLPQVSVIAALYIFVLSFWGVRLTVNWIVDWPGLKHQDWRYTKFKQDNPKMYPFTNFFGINMMPTFYIFAGMVPVFFAITYATSINALTIVGAVVCISAAVLQLVSDGQMRKFRHGDNKGKNMQTGLWKYSRHPNYFGEVSLWWGVWIMQMSVVPQYWLTVLGPLFMTGLFVFISIPLMKKRLLESKEGYAKYIETTSMLIPLPPKKSV